MSNEKLESLGQYFVRFNVREKYGVTFEQFTQLVEVDSWENILKSLKITSKQEEI